MTTDEIRELAQKAGFRWGYIKAEGLMDAMIDFAKLIAQHEREACAKIADEYVGQDLEHNFSALVAHNIRARK